MSLKKIFLNKNITKLALNESLAKHNHLTKSLTEKKVNLNKMGNYFPSFITPKRPLTTNSSNFEESDNSNYNQTTSIDQKEMKHFKALANSWWIENGEFEGLHKMNALRVPLVRDTMINYRSILPQAEKEKLLSYTDENKQTKVYTDEELISEPLLGLNIIDIGCGGGIFSEPLARLGAQVTAIDACKENIVVAQLRMESELERTKGKNSRFYDRLRYINCTVEDLAAVEDNFNYFDAIVCSEVVEHVNHLEDFIENSVKLLKNNGFAFYTTINRTTQSYLLAILAAEYVLNLVPRGTHDWNKFVKPDELKNILEKNETFVKFDMGMCYNPITRNWSWSQDKSINFAMYAQKYQTNLK